MDEQSMGLSGNGKPGGYFRMLLFQGPLNIPTDVSSHPTKENLNMLRWMSALLATLLVAGTLLASAGNAQDGLATVTVQISGFKGKEGVALVTLYAGEDTWLNIPKALQVVRSKITGSSMTVEFKGVKPGTYAVSVVHDANKNNEMDMRWLPWPKPKEGAGASNDPETKAGPPKWENAKFDLTAKGITVKATVKYGD